MIQILIITIFTLGLLTSCSVQDDVDQMIESTDEMNETTKDMNKTTKEVAKTSKELNETTKDMEKTTGRMEQSTTEVKDRTNDLFGKMRLIESVRLVEDSFDKSHKARKNGEKLDHALIMFSALEFQHWQGDYDDDAEQRNALFEKSIDLVFSKVLPLVNDTMVVDARYFDRTNDWLTLSAMSIAMSKILTDQEVLAKKLNFEAVSFYDLLTQALQQKSKYEAGEKIAHWAEKILKFEDEAIYLLQLRHNYFKAVFAAAISDIEDSWWGIPNALGKWWSVWEFDMDQHNSAQIHEWAKWLWMAESTKEFLKINLAIEPVQNKMFSDILKNLRFVESNKKYYDDIGPDFNSLSPATQGSEKQDLMKRMLYLIGIDEPQFIPVIKVEVKKSEEENEDVRPQWESNWPPFRKLPQHQKEL